jgi:hypothetical protein
MARSLVAGCLLVVLVLLAGCNGLADGSATPTLTPANASAGSSDRGISASGVQPSALADTHDTVLSTTNYTLVVHERVLSANRTLRNTTFHREVARGGDRYSINRTHETSGIRSTTLAQRIDVWYDGEAALTRLGGRAEARYQRTPTSPPGPLPDPSSHWRIEDAVAAFEVQVSERPNASGYRVVSTRDLDADSLATPTYVGQARNASLRALVADDGVVRYLRVSYDATYAGRPDQVRVVRSVRVSRIGATTVEAPPWTVAVPEQPGGFSDGSE